MSTVKCHIITDAMENAGIDTEYIMPEYSGRGMYGDTCIAFSCDSINQLAKFFVWLGYNAADNDFSDNAEIDLTGDVANALAASLQTDSLGYSIVACFPGWEIVE